MRCFIAIELPETAKTALFDLQRDLAKCGSDVRWVKPDNIHLTLQFLGDIEENIVESIIGSIKGTCCKHSAFKLEIAGINVFPNLRSPSVLWVGLGSHEYLSAIQMDIETKMTSLGIKPENRRFIPHLTLGRFKSSSGKNNLLDIVKLKRSAKFGLIKVNSVSLMRSNLGRTGATYSTIAKIDLINT